MLSARKSDGIPSKLKKDHGNDTDSWSLASTQAYLAVEEARGVCFSLIHWAQTRKTEEGRTPWIMFRNTFQSGFLSILYSLGSTPLEIWQANGELMTGGHRRASLTISLVTRWSTFRTCLPWSPATLSNIGMQVHGCFCSA